MRVKKFIIQQEFIHILCSISPFAHRVCACISKFLKEYLIDQTEIKVDCQKEMKLGIYWSGEFEFLIFFLTFYLFPHRQKFLRALTFHSGTFVPHYLEASNLLSRSYFIIKWRLSKFFLLWIRLKGIIWTWLHC